jgi:hypothetical protein
MPESLRERPFTRADAVAAGVSPAMLLVLAGLPEPRTNVGVHAEDGLWLARPDLSHPELRIALEYDGRHHLLDDEQWARDIGRKEALDRRGWRVIVVTVRDLDRIPG